MKTLEEIKALVYPTEKIDWFGVLKDLLALKTKNGELVTFGDFYLYDFGDANLYVDGVSLVNDNLIVLTSVMYGDEHLRSLIGTVSVEESDEDGIYLAEDAIKRICERILEDKCSATFDFSSMKSLGFEYFDGDYIERKLNRNKYKDKAEKLKSYIDGTSRGYIKI